MGLLIGTSISRTTKRLRLELLLVAALCLVEQGSAQTAPANDFYTNRIQLVGTDVTFTGTAAGATREEGEGVLMGTYGLGHGRVIPTVWWTWTAPVSGHVTVNLASYSDPAVRGPGAFIAFWDFINWDFDNGFLWGTSPCGKNLDLPGYAQFSFFVEAGATYDIQVGTAPRGTFTFHLVETNTPLIFVQPQDRAVAVNDSSFFGVMPGGPGPFHYQWRFGGTDMAGETHSVLAVENVDSTKAGSYSVVVSNGFGSVESSAATLTVRTNYVGPRLSVVAVNTEPTITFALSGEALTYYRIQSSSDLKVWIDERSFVLGRPYLGPTSVIFNRESTTTVSVFSGQGTRFYRAVVYQPSFNPTNWTLAESQHCINNLRRVRFAKEFWMTERTMDAYNWQQYSYDTPPGSDLDWGADLTGPHCSGGQDCMNSQCLFHDGMTFPTCSVDEAYHVLEEPADVY